MRHDGIEFLRVVFPMLAVTQRYLQSHPDQSALISEIEQFLLEGGVDDC